MKRLIIALMTIVAQANYSQRTLNINDCARLSVEISKSIKAAKYLTEAAKAKVEETKALLYPEASANLSYIRIGEVSEFEIPMGPGGQKQKFSFGTQNRISGEAKVQYQAYTFNRVSKTIELAEKSAEASKLDEEGEKNSIIASCIQSYIEVFFNKKIISIIEEQLKRAEKNLELTKSQYEAGKLSELDLKRAENRTKTISIQLEDAKSNYLKSKISLAKIIGAKETDFEISDDSLIINFNIEYENAVKDLAKRSIALKRLNKQKELLEYQKELAELSSYPNIFLFANYTVNNGFNPIKPNDLYDNWSVGVQFVWKFFDGFSSKHSVEGLILRQKAIETQSDEVIDNLQSLLSRAYIQLEQARRNINLAKSSIELAKSSYESSLIQYENGLISQLDLINFEEAILGSEFSALQAKFSEALAVASICKILENYSAFIEEK